MNLPRGIRNNNPGNIDRNSTEWQGMSPKQEDMRFINFTDPKYGIRALMKLLLTYEHKYGLTTVMGLINKYAPPNENATGSYVFAVADHLGVDAAKVINVEKSLIPLAQAIVLHENGKPPAPYPQYWYDDAVYSEAETLALGG